ncbi:sulfite exporter TauE/SafE family protein [Streptomyces lancefieldiae]|uniref:Probable membrane transporter protein n=1 Tax=Streptomyces lancefieldiae TaxID=3075520 RepID=A0ABU3AH12_9ACTN|nr:sulfite exporter TauE/SafE family protein [Streptomyces sp. DSM 40712]MDT0609213.1 sulfite exporter TauE/SafE family protein [Streptomyces sp. DSM 40712]
MNDLALLGIGLLTGVTTVLFGFGGGFVAVPVVVWADAVLGADAMRVATATSALVMVVNAGFATAVTPRRVLAALRGNGPLLLLLAAGGGAGALATRHAPPGLVRWAFVAYVALTIVDLLLRPGFLRPRAPETTRDAPRPLPAVVGAPVGAVAAFLGVGGSVMTVPAMRRAGHTMHVATALANPLTLAVALPAAVVLLGGAEAPAPAHTHVHLVGLVDLRAAAALLLGALPVITVLRRRPPRIPDRIYAWTYIALLGAVTVAMVLSH